MATARPALPCLTPTSAGSCGRWYATGAAPVWSRTSIRLRQLVAASLTAVGSGAVLRGLHHGDRQELWKTDGSAAGTVLVQDVYQGTTGSNPQNLRDINGSLFFTATDGSTGIETLAY